VRCALRGSLHRGNGSGSPYGPKLSLEGGAEQIRSDREITLGPKLTLTDRETFTGPRAAEAD